MRVANRRSLIARALVGLTMLSASAMAARADELDPALSQIPSNAQFVALARNLSALQTKVNNLAVQLQLPVPPDMIGMFSKQIGINGGLDTSGSAAVVKVPLPKNADVPPTASGMVALLPTTDAKAMLAGFKPSDPVDGISTVTLPNEAESGFSAVTEDGKFVLLSDNKDSLAAYLAGLKTKSIAKVLSVPAGEQFLHNDVIFYSDVSSVREQVLQSVDSYVAMFRGMMAMAQARQGGADATELTKGIMDVELAELRKLITDASWTSTGIRLGEDGIGLTEAVHFMPTSKFALLCKNHAGLTAPDLSLLPADDYLLAGSATVDPDSLQSWMRDIGDEFLKDDTIANSAKLPDYKKMVDATVQTWGQVSAFKGSFVALPDTSKGLINGVMLIDSKDPDGYIKNAVELAKESTTAQANPMMKTTVTIKEKAVNVQGVDFTRIAMKFDKADNAPADDMAAQMMAKQLTVMMGADSTVNEYVGVVGGKVMVVVTNDPALIDRAVTAVLTKDNKLASGGTIGASNKDTLEAPMARAYLPILTWLTVANRYRGTAPAPAGGALAVGAVPAPAVVSAKTSDDGITGEFYLPRRTLISIVEQGKRLAGGE
jgi:hypothetical protein